ncbi:glycoside hydrolase family 32 protein [Enterococcus sp. CWB-B31]|uniref:glycoside hydrolase family 32 protein n=1 Tax=Enterococcus sp. CWB-B31 TaxID=2885159 RepID=UPI001E2C6369|nr:sucrose-6-phosphate hydrolase [Enterococcus sp. CWB-B31]MCB5953598.1 sucrose-6-phosphate hydrolase [Enterococcus sp. CWB-B31]
MDEQTEKIDYSLGYHIFPKKGLLNDPNGLIKFKGFYHVFYQLNPQNTTHENKCWGHAYSVDLIHWQQAEIALFPDKWFDKDGVYSGSAVEYQEKLYVFYTGNVIDAAGINLSYQCMAVSEDGFTFRKIGPIFPHPKGYTRHVRDPKVWYDPEQQGWYLLLGAQTNEKQGEALVYFSKDLIEWEGPRLFLRAGDERILEQNGYMWECPDLLHFEEQDIFIYSPQGIEEGDIHYKNLNQTVYRSGKFENGIFSTDMDMREIDWGFDYYAPQSFKADGRVLSLGWMGSMFPEQETTVPTIEEGWLHMLTIPRELTVKDDHLIQRPVAELQQLRTAETKFNVQNEIFTFPNCRLELLSENYQGFSNFSYCINDNLYFNYDASEKKVQLNRLNWFNGEIEVRELILDEPLYQYQWYLESTSSELFLNEGKHVASARFFPKTSAATITFSSEKINEILIYELAKVM